MFDRIFIKTNFSVKTHPDPHHIQRYLYMENYLLYWELRPKSWWVRDERFTIGASFEDICRLVSNNSSRFLWSCTMKNFKISTSREIGEM